MIVITDDRLMPVAFAFGILADKERQYQGEASAIIEHRQVVTIDEVRNELEQMKRGAADAEVED